MKKLILILLLITGGIKSFAQGGFDVKGALAPLGNYAISYNYNIRGVTQNKQHLTGRDSILTVQSYLVSPGLLCFVADSNKTYRLRANLTTWDEFGSGVINTASNGLIKVGNDFRIDPAYTALYVPYTGATSTLNMGANSIAQTQGVLSTGINPGIIATLNTTTNKSVEIRSDGVYIYDNASNSAKIRVNGLVTPITDTIQSVPGTFAMIPRLTGLTTDSIIVKRGNVTYAISQSSIVSLPGGSNTNVQFNNSGIFGGNNNLTYSNSGSNYILALGTNSASNTAELILGGSAGSANFHTQGSPLTITSDATDYVTTPSGTGHRFKTNGIFRFTIADNGDINIPAFSTGVIQSNSSGLLSSSPSLNLPATASPTYGAGKLYYDTGNESLTFFNNDSNIGLQIGQEEWIRVLNNSGSTITNGSAVYISGASTGLPTIALAQANSGTTTIGVGLTTESIANGAIGYVTSLGVVHGLNTAPFTAGPVYISETTPGALTQTVPSSPNFRYRIGIVTVVDASIGAIHVTPSTAMPGNGTANQLLGMNNGATGQEYKSIFGTSAGQLGLGVAPTLAGLQLGGIYTGVSTNVRGIYFNGTLRSVANNSTSVKLDLSGGSFDNVTGSTILTLGIRTVTTGGSAYTNGVYTGVTLTGGAPTTAAIATITVTGGAVTGINVTSGGLGYAIGNSLSASAASIGGTGSGFTFVLATNDLSYSGTTQADILLSNGGSILPAVDNTASIGSVTRRFNSVVTGNIQTNFWLTNGNVSVNILNASTGSYATWFNTGNYLLDLGATQTDNGYRIEANGAIKFRGNGLLKTSTITGILATHTMSATDNNQTSVGLDIISTFDNNTTALQTLGTITGGSGYTNGTGTFTLTGGSPTTAATASITRVGGVVTAVTIVTRGKGYTTSDVLSAAIPTGTGFSIPVTVVGLTGVTNFGIRTNSPIGMTGSSSGTLTMQTQASFTSYNWNWPTTAGSLGDVLVSGGGGSTAQTYTQADILLSTTTGIDAKATGSTAILTVPSGKTAIITRAVVRCTSASSITIGPSGDVGVTAGNIFANTTMTGLQTTTDIFHYNSVGMSKAATTGQVINYNNNTAATGTSETIAVDLFGYYK